jgi:hypothetical protein
MNTIFIIKWIEHLFASFYCLYLCVLVSCQCFNHLIEFSKPFSTCWNTSLGCNDSFVSNIWCQNFHVWGDMVTNCYPLLLAFFSDLLHCKILNLKKKFHWQIWIWIFIGSFFSFVVVMPLVLIILSHFQ